MTVLDQTRGQVERTLTQRIQNLYQQLVGQRPSRGTTHISDRRVMVILQDIVPPVERLLMDTGHVECARQLQDEIQAAIKPAMRSLIEEVIGVPVTSLLIAGDSEAGFASLAALLTESPTFRVSVPKNASSDSSNGA